MFDISEAGGAILVGVVLASIGQLVLLWRSQAVNEARFAALGNRMDEAASKARVESLAAEVNHVHECIERTRKDLTDQIDRLRREAGERDVRLWSRLDTLGDKLSELAGQWSGVVLERTAQSTRPKSVG